MCRRGGDRMDPFAMDFDKEENIEMTDDNNFTDMTPEYMFQKSKLVLFLLVDKMAYLGPMSQLRLEDKLDISDDSVFHIQQELGPVGGNDRRLVSYKMFVGLLQDVGMLKMCEMLRAHTIQHVTTTGTIRRLCRIWIDTWISVTSEMLTG